MQVRVFDTDKDKIPNVGAAEDEIIPKHPFSVLICASTGRGKTNFFRNLLEAYRWPSGNEYFQKTIICGPTVGKGGDALWAHLKPSQSKTDPSPEWLREKMDEQKEAIKKAGSIDLAPRMLLAFEDISFQQDLLNSQEFVELLLTHRHYSISVAIITQCLRGLVPRKLRLQVHALFFAPGTDSENMIVAQEFGKGRARDFVDKVIGLVAQDKHAFLGVMRKAKEKYRKGLDNIIEY